MSELEKLIKLVLKCVPRRVQHRHELSDQTLTPEHTLMSAQPEIGAWYRLQGGESFEVVALDEDDGTIELQYFDGTVGEMELQDWEARRSNGEIADAEAPEDWSGSVDVDSEDDAPTPNSGLDGDSQLAGGLDDLDRFEPPDSLM
jgi:hypothetical protein